MMNTRFSTMLALGISLVPAFAQQPDQAEAPLVANPEADGYAIAEQLYAQARNTADPVARAQAMRRAAELFSKFTVRFPKSANAEKALYLQAICQAEAGDAVASNNTLGVLANQRKGEYAAAAAYKLANQATERQMWQKAIGFYHITVRETQRAELRNDALYRLGRAQLQSGQRKEAESTFRTLQVMQGIDPLILQTSLLSMAQMKTEDGNDAEAYTLFCDILKMTTLDERVRASATLQAARLASRLGKNEESQQLYGKLAHMKGMEKYAGEAQMENILSLYKAGKYAEVVRRASSQTGRLDDPAKESRRAIIVGQSAMEIKQYEAAAVWFELAEKAQPGTPLAADAGYRRLICIQQIRGANFFQQAEKYISTYAVPGSATVALPCVDLVRLMYADRLMATDTAASARQFDALNFENLPEAVRPDAMYKKAWTAAQGDAYDPLPTLNRYIESFPADHRIPDALTLRGTFLGKQGKLGDALADFDRVIRDYPDSDSVTVCWQRAARLCAGKDADKMVYYYKGFITQCEELAKQGTPTKPGALAEAHYNVAGVLADKEPATAVTHFQEARTIYPEQYASLVDIRLVQCFFKMQDAENLKKALEELERTNQASYKGLPAAILRWCGWTRFQSHDYLAADKYLSDSLPREPREKYTAADGSEQERPKVEPIVWKTLARARLELRLYARGLEAAEHYVSMEKQPYRLAEGMRDQAQLLIGLGRGEEARKICETAIALGIDGPIKSTLFISLGDAYYIDGEYSEAAKYYGRTANVVSDKELKPLALYKIASALKKCGKEGEASQYENTLKTEFPHWAPSANVLHLMEEQKHPEPAPAA
ncbi:MAG: tetratricopeptide repeat protein [Akkermansia sp.]|nr:tetratricopeptide repeat protein [Akkermansia sp.]